jgi:hypothetical protein
VGKRQEFADVQGVEYGIAFFLLKNDQPQHGWLSKNDVFVSPLLPHFEGHKQLVWWLKERVLICTNGWLFESQPIKISWR